MLKNTLPIETLQPLYGKKMYPLAVEFMEQQQNVNWFSQEIKVENDKQDFLIRMSPEQLQLAKINTQIFVELEQDVGDIWDQISHWFPHYEIEAAAVQMKAMEISVHAPFYQKLSDVLLIDPQETLALQTDVRAIKSKLELLKDILANASTNKLLSLATLTMIEQVLLFSNFAMLKSFQANGNNYAINTMQGLDFVIRDETIHGEFAKFLYHTLLAETKEANPDFDYSLLINQIEEVADEILGHEDAVTNYIFDSEDTVINSIRRVELKGFTRERMNFVFETLGLPTRYLNSENNISEWFFKDKESLSITDFFARGASNYTRDWSEVLFSRLPHMKGLLYDNK